MGEATGPGALPVVDARAGSSGTRIDWDDVCRWFHVGGSVVEAVDQVNLHVDEEAFVVVAVLGASGSGKMTLLTLISALDEPTAGTVRLAGRDLTTGCPTPVRRCSPCAACAGWMSPPRCASSNEFGGFPPVEFSPAKGVDQQREEDDTRQDDRGARVPPAERQARHQAQDESGADQREAGEDGSGDAPR